MITELLLAATLAGAPSSAVVIRSGDVAITAEMVAAQAKDARSYNARLTAEQIVDGLATEAALAWEARRTGFAKKPDPLALVRREQNRVLAGLFVEELGRSANAVPEAEILRLYHDGNDTARLSVVVVATRDEASAVRSRLQGGATFKAEASRSLDPAGASSGGDAGTRSRSQIDPALAAEAFQAPLGGLVGPVQLRNGGWAVARVVERTIARDADLPKVRERIAAYALRQAVAAARSHALEMYRRSTPIAIDEKLLSSLGGRIEPRGAEADAVIATVGDQKLLYRDLLPALRELQKVGHGSVTLKKQVTEGLVDDVLLATEARRRKLDQRPDSRAALERAEIHAMAREMARSILAAEPSSSAEKLDALLARRGTELRKRNEVWVDRPAAIAAAGAR